MEKTLNIYQKINAVMQEVKYVQKENKKVNGQYTFVSHDAVTGILHDPLAKYGIVMIPNTDKIVQDGNRTSVEMTISFINSDQPEDRFSIRQFGYGIDTQDKGIGKAISYAVKYALLKVFCLETGDDVEKDNIEYKTPEISNEMLDNTYKNILLQFPEEDREDFEKYKNVWIEKHKVSLPTLLFDKFQQHDNLKTNFYNWKKKQSKVA